MKKIILLAFVILIFSGAEAQVVLNPLVGKAQVVFRPLVGASYGTEKYRIRDSGSDMAYTALFPDLKITTGLTVSYKGISAMYKVDTWCSKSKGISFDPKETSYEVGISYEILRCVRISFSHCCFHAVRSDSDCGSHGGMYGGWNMIGVKFEKEIKL